MNYETLSGKAVRAIRIILADRRMSIQDLSDESGISLSTLKRRLLGLSPLTVDELGVIAETLDLPVLALLDSASLARVVAA